MTDIRRCVCRKGHVYVTDAEVSAYPAHSFRGMMENDENYCHEPVVSSAPVKQGDGWESEEGAEALK